MLRTENAEQSMNVSGEKVNDLPLNFGGGGGGRGRHSELAQLHVPGARRFGHERQQPGNNVVNGIPSGTYGNFKVYLEGQDSTSVNDASWTSTVPAASWRPSASFRSRLPTFPPSSARWPAGFYNFTTKSGTNQIARQRV